MSWYPIAFTPPQYEDASGNPYSGAVLKFYRAGTSTNIAMATSASGATQITSVALNSNGNPSHSGSVIIPHIEEDYKIMLYPNQAAADANTGAIWSIDDVNITTASNTGAVVDVASASTVVLNSTETNYFKITGTTTISTVTLAEGREVVVRFEGALTLTNSAFLVNIGAGDITTEAGDIAVLRGEASGVVRMLSYTRASGSLFNIASLAEWASGAANKLLSAVNFLPALLAALGVSKYYESAEISLTANTLSTFTHSFGRSPKEVWAVLRCKTAEHGYAVGDEIIMDNWSYTQASTNDYNNLLACNTTNVYLRTGNGGASGSLIRHLTNGTIQAPTAANWRWVVRARG